MKSILLIALLMTFSATINAQNKLVVFNQDGKQFYIILNGIKQNAEPKTNVKIEQLTSDSYKLKVIFADGSTPDVDKAIYFGDPNHEYVTELKKNNKGVYKIRMVSYGPTATNSYQAANTLNYTNTNATTNNNTVTTHQTTTTVTTNNNGNGNGNNENVNMDVNIGGVGMNVNVNIDENNNNGTNTNTNTTYTETYTTTTTNTTNTNINNGQSNGCYTSNVDINSIISAVKNESFADDKKMVAKQAIQNKCISSDQTIKLLGEYSFDDDKLEIAKYCYDRCSDKDNFFKVNSAFTFSDSKEALNKYIGSKQ